MRNFQILTDSVCDLPKTWLCQYSNITIVDTPIVVAKGDESVTLRNLGPDDFGQVADYVNRGYSAHTSCPDIYATEDAKADRAPTVEGITTDILEKGYDVLYIAMSSTLSSTYGYIARLYEELAQKYPDREVLCVDSECMSSGLGLLVMDVLKGCSEGIFEDARAAVTFIKETRGGIAHVFSWSEFSFIRKSGRVGLLPAFLGGALKFQPFCSCEYNDRKDGSRVLIPVKSNVRGKDKFAQLVARFAAETITEPDGTIIVAHGNCQEFADQITEQIKLLLPEANILCGHEWRVGSGVQVHGGPTSVHINFHRTQPNQFSATCDLVKHLA